MNAFRTKTVDCFPYMEGILHENLSELTLRFLGSDTQASIAIRFELLPSVDREAGEKVDTFSGRYLCQENKDMETSEWHFQPRNNSLLYKRFH